MSDEHLVGRAWWATPVVATLLGGALLILILLVATPQAALAAPSQSLPQAAPQVQSGQRDVALAPTLAPQPTQFELAEPTAGTSLPATPSASTYLGSNGLTIAVTLSCLTFFLGLGVGSAALIILLRGGYGPFLRTLLPSRRRDSRSARAQRPGRGGSPAQRGPAPTMRRR